MTTDSTSIDNDDATKDNATTKSSNTSNISDDSQDFVPLMIGIVKSIDYKYYTFMFLVFLFITSDVFSDRILSHIDGALEGTPTPFGTIIQAITLIVSMLIVHVLITKEII